PAEAAGDPAARNVGKFFGFRDGAAGRHGQDGLAVRRMDAQGVAARAAMPAQLDREELRAVPDLESRGFGRPPIQERARSHVWKSGEQQFARILPYPPPGKSLGAKTNHLPNIQGLARCRPLPAGAGSEKFGSKAARMRDSRVESTLIHSCNRESEFSVWIQAVNAAANRAVGLAYSAA